MMVSASGLFLLLALFSVALAQSVPLTRYYATDANPAALCNDGTPGAFYYRPGTGDGALKWVIRLQGGGWCYDEPSCASRKEYSVYWTTSNVCPASLYDNQTISNVGHEGILSSDPNQNPFYNYNHVWLWYCSSDSHAGNITNSPINGWNFMGKTIVQSMMILLNKNHGLNDSVTDILLTGDSAGGVATISNVDYIGNMVSTYAPKANYRAFVDCAWFLDIPAYGTSGFSFQQVARDLFTNWNAVYDASCVEFYGPGNEWHCFHAQYLLLIFFLSISLTMNIYAWPHIQTLAFYQEFQFDSANLGFDDAAYPFNATTQQFALNFQASMLSAQQKLPYLFSPNCYKHEVIDQLLFTSIKIGNVSIADAVYDWFVQPAPPPMTRHVDTCQGIGCNPTCGPL